MTSGDGPVPKTVDEALDRIEDEFIYPEKVILQVDANGFTKVIDYIYYEDDVEKFSLKQGKDPAKEPKPIDISKFFEDAVESDDFDDIPF